MARVSIVREHHRLARFVVVGCLAAAVHWSVVVALVTLARWAPLVANVPGWLVALGVSFTGHHRWTFGDVRAPRATAARRFALVSAAGFAVNEAAYAWLLHGHGLRYDLALAGVLVGVAVFTYVVSRGWAFARTRAHGPPGRSPP